MDKATRQRHARHLFANYVAGFLNEELNRFGIDGDPIDPAQVEEAIDAFEGGAHDNPELEDAEVQIVFPNEGAQ